MHFQLSISCCHRRARQEARAENTAAEDWDVISLPSDEQSEGDPEPDEEEEEVETRQPTAAEEGHTDFRWYTVWGVAAGRPAWVGVHCGPRRSAYDGLLRLNGGSFGGLRFKRLASHQAAKRLYITKTERNATAILAGSVPEPFINYNTWKCRQ